MNHRKNPTDPQNVEIHNNNPFNRQSAKSHQNIKNFESPFECQPKNSSKNLSFIGIGHPSKPKLGSFHAPLTQTNKTPHPKSNQAIKVTTNIFGDQNTMFGNSSISPTRKFSTPSPSKRVKTFPLKK